MAFPAVVIVQNVSVFVFPFLLKSWSDLNYRIFSIRFPIQFVIVFFAIGAIASVLMMPTEYSPSSVSNALAVLPNYLYWSLLVIVMINVRRFIFLDIAALYRAIFLGVILSCLYFFFLFPSILEAVPFFKRITQNAFAFLLICFSPIASYYCWKQYGRYWGVLFLAVLAILGFLSGSRSGSILVLVGSSMAVLVERLKLGNIFFLLVFMMLTYVVVYVVPMTREVVNSLNSRTHDLIYESESVLRTDQSYLIRVAMIEKAMVIHEKYPATGIGLNNFTSYEVNLPGNFVGSELVLRKKRINETSAHNSYIGILAEGGLVLLIPFLLMLSYCFLSFFRGLDKMPSVMKPVFIGLLGMSVHLYFIMAIVNVFAWFLIGLACAFSVMTNRREVMAR